MAVKLNDAGRLGCTLCGQAEWASPRQKQERRESVGTPSSCPEIASVFLGLNLLGQAWVQQQTDWYLATLRLASSADQTSLLVKLW